MLVSPFMGCDNLEKVDLAELNAGKAYVTPVFHDNGDGTVTDTTSNGIMWHKCAYNEGADNTCAGSAAAITWSNADTYCKSLSTAGYTDWRIPTLKELRTLKGLTGTSDDWFKDYATLNSQYWWSSTFEAVRVFVSQLTAAGSENLSATTNNYYLRCVRSLAP